MLNYLVVVNDCKKMVKLKKKKIRKMRSFLIFLRSQIQGSGLHRAQILSGLLRHLDGGPGLAARDHVPSNVNLIISEIKINFKNHILEKFLREYKL